MPKVEYAPKQLSMTLTGGRLRTLAEPTVPDGYRLRGYERGDEDEWAELLVLCGFEEWSREKMDEYLRDPDRREGSSIVVRRDHVVAATFATPLDSPPRVGALDYVVCHPDHRDRGLGRAVCVAVSRFFRERGYESVYLTTDDWRLPAISIYLSLGFEPEMTREDMPGRWASVTKRLAAARDEGVRGR